MKSLTFFIFPILFFPLYAFPAGLHCEENSNGNAIPADNQGRLGQFFFHDVASCRAAISEAAKGLICVGGNKNGYAQPYFLAGHRALGDYYFLDVDSCVKSIQHYDGQFVCVAGNGNSSALYDVMQDIFVDANYRASLDSCLESRPLLNIIESRHLADGGVLLEAASCDILNRQSKALVSFDKRLGGSSSEPPACTCEGTRCDVRIDTVAPNLVKKMENVVPDYDGPNCWNAALVFAQIVPSFRHSSEAEISFWLSSPLCRELGAQEEPSPGDIVEIRQGNRTEIHGFIYLTPELALSKNGNKASSPYYLQTPEEVFGVYSVPEACRRVQGVRAECSVYANYFTCEPYSKYVSQVRPPVTTDYTTLQTRIDSLESQVSELALHGKHTAQPLVVRNQLYQEIQTLQAAVNSGSAPYRNDPMLSMLWRSLAMRLNSFYIQLGLVR
jgi:hypothetical protein